MQKNTLFVSLGSNLGDRKAYLDQAVARIKKNHGILIKKVSRYYETSPEGNIKQDYFLNAVLQAETDMEPSDLLAFLQGIEISMGRARLLKWGPRTIDLDIIYLGDLIIDQPDLKIPHPLAHERSFVLKPLSEIAPDFVHPVLKKTTLELLRLI